MAISRAAGIPAEAWENSGRGLGAPDIDGMPLSLMLQEDRRDRPRREMAQGNRVVETPDFYAGKVDFAMQYDAGNMQVELFELLDYGMRIVRNQRGWWKRTAAATGVLLEQQESEAK